MWLCSSNRHPGTPHLENTCPETSKGRADTSDITKRPIWGSERWLIKKSRDKNKTQNQSRGCNALPQNRKLNGRPSRRGLGFLSSFFSNLTWPHSEFKKYHFPFSCKGKCPTLSNVILFLVCFSGHGRCVRSTRPWKSPPSPPPLLHLRNLENSWVSIWINNIASAWPIKSKREFSDCFACF